MASFDELLYSDWITYLHFQLKLSTPESVLRLYRLRLLFLKLIFLGWRRVLRGVAEDFLDIPEGVDLPEDCLDLAKDRQRYGESIFSWVSPPPLMKLPSFVMQASWYSWTHLTELYEVTSLTSSYLPSSKSKKLPNPHYLTLLQSHLLPYSSSWFLSFLFL